MVADTYTTILGLILQGTGNNNNNWGTVCDNQMISPVDRAIAGMNTHTDVGGTIDLSASPPPAALRQDIDFFQQFTGALTSDLTVIVPAISKTWCFINGTSGNFNLFVKTAAQAIPMQVPQSTTKFLFGNGTNVYRLDVADVGAFVHSGGTSAPAGTLACNGSSLLRAEYPQLFAAIGTTWGSVDSTHFTLPLLTDTNRFLRAGGGSGPAIGTYQANQNLAHTHSFTGTLSIGNLSTDSQGSHSHTLNLSDNGHVHGFQGPTGNSTTPGNNFPISGPIQNTQTNTAFTGITGGIVPAGAHSHNVTGAPGIGTLANASQGGTEARPESAAVMISIRY